MCWDPAVVCVINVISMEHSWTFSPKLHILTWICPVFVVQTLSGASTVHFRLLLNLFWEGFFTDHCDHTSIREFLMRISHPLCKVTSLKLGSRILWS